MNKLPDPSQIYLLVSYQQLESLLSAVKELPELKNQVFRCYEQLDACRSIQIEILEKYKELEDLI